MASELAERFLCWYDNAPPPIAAPTEDFVAWRLGELEQRAAKEFLLFHHIEIGKSREGRRLFGGSIGKGKINISITAGAHSDEPGGPLAALALMQWLLEDGRDLDKKFTWSICPHVNPDGAEKNAAWFSKEPDVWKYVEHVFREPPGDDVEFGYPLADLADSMFRDAHFFISNEAGASYWREYERGQNEQDGVASFAYRNKFSMMGWQGLALRHVSMVPNLELYRIENKLAASFLIVSSESYHLHASLHGMGFAEGAWWLIGKEWADRTGPLRASLRELFERLDLGVHDIDRRGEKGFTRIERGFSTTPTSIAMRDFFLRQNDPETAAKFLPSSMEFIQSLGGDPLVMVSEIPIFRLHGGGEITDPPQEETPYLRFRKRLNEIRASRNEEALRQLLAEFDVRPVSFHDQIKAVACGVLEAVQFLS